MHMIPIFYICNYIWAAGFYRELIFKKSNKKYYIQCLVDVNRNVWVVKFANPSHLGQPTDNNNCARFSRQSVTNGRK
jgi:hypothetical protein